MNAKSNTRRPFRGQKARKPQASKPQGQRVPTWKLYAVPNTPEQGVELTLYPVGAKGAEIVVTPAHVVVSQIRETITRTDRSGLEHEQVTDKEVFDFVGTTDRGQFMVGQVTSRDGSDELVMTRRPRFAADRAELAQMLGR